MTSTMSKKFHRNSQTREVEMRTSNLVHAAVIATVAAALGAVQPAAAKTKPKPTYEEAWKICQAEVDRSKILRADAGQRYAAGGACMHRYGYRP
jgi:hypothetical protein